MIILHLFVRFFENVCLGNPKNWDEEIKCNGTCRELFFALSYGYHLSKY